MSQVNKRHQLVLLFSDLADSTGIAAQFEPEQYGELLAQLRRQVTTIVERHGGEVVRIDGDGVLCIFGYPIAHEDAGRRAVEAALDLHAAVSALELASAGPAPHLRMHSGIHAGVVLLRSGDVVRGRYEMLGDATNVAARLCDAAGAGGILVSAETLGADRHFFRTGPSITVTISGRGAPIDAWPIEGRAATPNRFAARASAGLTPFVGRDAQRREILHWLDAPASEPAVLILHGPPGIGKSRLLSETAKEARAAGWTVESGYCEAYLGAPPLQPFVQVQQSIDPGNAASAAELAKLIGDLAAKAPLRVMIDDWQWADDASRDLLRMVSEACAGGSARLKFLLTSREERDPQTAEFACVALPVPPLGPDDVSSTIARLLKGADPFSARRIEAAAGGSPLLLEELCHAFAAGKAAPAGDPRGAWFDLAVQARFSELPADDARLLRLAAVIGHSVPLGLLAAVWGNALDPRMLERLTENNKPALFYAMANLAQIHADQGDFGEADSLFEEIERLRDACDFPVQSSLMTQQAAIQIWKGDFAQAARFGALAEQFGIRDRSRQNAMLGAALRAYAEFNIGGEAKQADAFLEALHWLDRSNYRHRISLFHGWGADLLARTGQVQEARKVAAKAFARARYGDSFGVSTAARALAWLAACGHGRRSCDHYLKLADRSDFMRQSAWSMAETEFCRARIAELQGDPVRAASHAAGAQDRFIQLGMAERAKAALALREAMPSR